MRISEVRAKYCADIIVDRGTPAEIVSVDGKGASEPAIDSLRDPLNRFVH